MRNLFHFVALFGALILGACQPSIQEEYTEQHNVDEPIEAALMMETETAFKRPRSFQYLPENSVLVFSGTQDWRHDSGISGSLAFWAKESDSMGTGLFTTELPDIFAAETLEKFSVIILNSVTGAEVLQPKHHKAIELFVANGGGLILLHGSGDWSAAEKWPWLQDIIGTKFTSHPMAPQLQKARIVTLAPEHPVMEGLAEGFEHIDEWYSFDGPVKGKVTVLAGLDERSYSPINTVYGDISDLRMGPNPSDHPIVWAKCLGQKAGTGRMVYSALGHAAGAYDDEAHQTLLRNTMAWVRRDVDLEGRFCPN